MKETDKISIKRFIIIYLFLMSVFFGVISLKPFIKLIDLNGLYTQGVVIITSKMLGLLGIPCSFHGSIIMLPSLSLDVKFGCNGLEAVMMYSVAVLAYPSPWRRKALGIVLGFLILQIVNILRIVFLAYSGIYFRSIFEFIHIYIAQGMMIALSLGIFLLYLNHAKTIKTPIN